MPVISVPPKPDIIPPPACYYGAAGAGVALGAGLGGAGLGGDAVDLAGPLEKKPPPPPLDRPPDPREELLPPPPLGILFYKYI